MWTLITLAAVAVVLVLGWNLYRHFGARRITGFNDRRRPTSRLVSRGEFVDGSRRLEVALAVTRSSFFYENGDMQASINLQSVEDIEYDTELQTGLSTEGGQVLRLRAHSQTFEFVLPNDVVEKWKTILPPRQASRMEVGDDGRPAPRPVEASGSV